MVEAKHFKHVLAAVDDSELGQFTKRKKMVLS